MLLNSCERSEWKINILQTFKVSEKGEGGVPDEIALQPVEDLTLEQVDVPPGKLQLMESPCWSKFPGRGCSYGEEHIHERVFFTGTVACGGCFPP